MTIYHTFIEAKSECVRWAGVTGDTVSVVEDFEMESREPHPCFFVAYDNYARDYCERHESEIVFSTDPQK